MVLAKEVAFDEPGVVKMVVTTSTCNHNQVVTQVEAPKVKEVITSGPAIPVEKANAEPAPMVPKEEKSISDTNSFDLVVGIGSSSEVIGIIELRLT